MDHDLDPSPDEGAPAWMTSFADMVVLMLCFFVLLLSFAKTDKTTFHSALGSVRQALGGQRESERSLEQKGAAGADPSAPVLRPDRARPERERDAVERVRRLLAARGLESQVDVSTSPRGVILRTRDQILFDSAEATLLPGGSPVLDAVRELCAELQGELAVEGHSDDRPIQSPLFPSNWELSGARSAAVLRYMLAAGVDPAVLHVAGYADTRPVASNETEAGRAQNRRVEFVFEYGEPQAEHGTEPLPGAR